MSAPTTDDIADILVSLSLANKSPTGTPSPPPDATPTPAAGPRPTVLDTPSRPGSSSGVLPGVPQTPSVAHTTLATQRILQTIQATPRSVAAARILVPTATPKTPSTVPLPPLENLSLSDKGAETEAAVIIQNASYAHKFSRNVSARYLKSIVERPERLRAALIGVCALHSLYPDTPKFSIKPSSRSERLSHECVTDIHGDDYPTILHNHIHTAPGLLAKGELEVPQGWPSGDLYLSAGTQSALEGCVGAVMDGVDAVCAPTSSTKKALCLIRPPGHHCAPEAPSGFCFINNVAIAASYATKKYGITRWAVVDFDLHHGDGTQDIVWEYNWRQPGPPGSKVVRAGYFSLHDVQSFPCEAPAAERKVKEASLCVMNHDQAIWNVHLGPYTSEAEFDSLYRKRYLVLLEKCAEFFESNRGEECMLFISAGFDGSEYETPHMQRHAVSLPTAFYARFTQDLRRIADRFCGGRMLGVMEGGYSDRAMATGALSHLHGLVSDTPIPFKAPFADEKEAAAAAMTGVLPTVEVVSHLTHLPTIDRNVSRGSIPRSVGGAVGKWLERTVILVRSLLPEEWNGQKKKVEGEGLETPSGRMVTRSRTPGGTPKQES
ncbi:histone deacetylase [Saitoella coloradoensis]